MKVAIVEDHAMFVRLLAALIVKEGFELAGSATDGNEGLEMILLTQPDVVILDLQLPSMHGLDIAKVVKEKLPFTRILALSAESDPYTVHRAREIGIDGYLDKSDQALLDEMTLLDAIFKVAQGHKVFSPKITESARDNDFAKILSDREIEVLKALATCQGIEQIAQRLGVTEHAIQKHKQNIMGKIGVHSMTELVAYALEKGFVKSDDFHS